MTELEKENAELKKKNKELDDFDKSQSKKLLVKIAELDKEYKELKKQIEKMKCCGNCKNNGLNCIWF